MSLKVHLQNISELLFLFLRQENMELIGEMAEVAYTVIWRWKWQ